MSRLGKKAILLPAGVKVNITAQEIMLEGPKGKLSQKLHPLVAVQKDGEQLHVNLKEERTRADRAYHGLYRAIINNMVMGVTQGFKKTLDIVGVGYEAKIQGQELSLQIGFCHSVNKTIPKGLKVETPSKTRIEISGCDRQMVGQFAAEIRRVRPPEPYNGKGIRYEGEYIRKKAGKSFVSGGAGG